MFVGYPFGKKGWRIYDLESNDFFVSRDVVFVEDEFPYQETKEVLQGDVGVVGGVTKVAEDGDVICDNRGDGDADSLHEKEGVDVGQSQLPNEAKIIQSTEMEVRGGVSE